jgi:hypothetical protein
VSRNILSTILIVAALAAVAVWAVRQKRFELDSGVETATVIPAPPIRTVTSPPAETTPPPLDDSVLRLSIETLADSWVELEADGKKVVNVTLERGERRTLEANEAFRFIRIGNAAGLSLTLNGTRVPVLGEDGEVIRDRVFDRQTLETLRAESASRAQP